jgi:uncharacterized membrane protein HdeD (DUF308 family)
MSTPQEVIAAEKFELKEVYSTVEIEEDVMEAEVAKKFKFLIAVGIINLLFGICALFYPLTTSNIVVKVLAINMILIGLVNMIEFFGPKYYRGPAVAGGFPLVVLGFLMLAGVGTFTVMTILVALVYLVGGIFRAVLAKKHPEMLGSKIVFVSGIVAILISIIAIVTVIGIDFGLLPSAYSAAAVNFALLLGINWIAYGGQRIALGLKGRDLVKKDLESDTGVGGDYVNVA